MADRQFLQYNLRALSDLPEGVGAQQRLGTAARLAAVVDRAERHLYDAWSRYRYNYNDTPVWPPGRGDDRLAADIEDRKWNLVKYGIKVRAHVHISTIDPKAPLLMINVERLNEQGNPDWVSYAPPGEHYHVTVGPMEDIWKLPDWKRKVKYLYNKFDDKRMWLYPTRVTRGYTLELDKERDPIASDPIFQELHQTDKRWNEVPDPFERKPSEWVPNVPEPHVSM
jgi:hypothetical protein